MLKLSRRRMDLHKLSSYSVVINSLQILSALTVLILAVVRGADAFSDLSEQIILAVLSSIVIFGAVVDIRDARSAKRIGEESDMLEDACARLSDLNVTLRSQRHDFMNHLQVVYSLMEMNEYKEAQDYMEQVYQDIQRVSRALKTASPALNALLASKLSECEERGIYAGLDIRSDYEQLAMPDWELCRVFSNLIDNAMDAAADGEAPKVHIETTETLQNYRFEIRNTGPQIDRKMRDKLFIAGFSTKGDGRGMGLVIVKTIIESYGGALSLSSESGATAFSGTLPKHPQPVPHES